MRCVSTILLICLLVISTTCSTLSSELDRSKYYYSAQQSSNLPGVASISGDPQHFPCTPHNVTAVVEKVFPFVHSKLGNVAECLDCNCVNGRLRCVYIANDCPKLQYCPVIDNSKKGCCKPCRTCSFLGITYENGDKWLSSQDSCATYSCKAGVITRSITKCIPLCKHPIKKVGVCCAVCPENQIAPSISIVQLSTSRCINCFCDQNENWCYCAKVGCPVLDCPLSEQVHPSNQSCCPECQKSKSYNLVNPSKCYFREQSYSNGEYFRPDSCTLCWCDMGTLICRRYICEEHACPTNRIYYEPNVCCPLCRKSDPIPCKYQGVEYDDRSSWNPDECSQCNCNNSKTYCKKQQCKADCPKGYMQVKKKGQCCPECEERSGICTVYGDPHFETFDGKEYNFQGSCRYILAKDCYSEKSKFRVIVQNDPRSTTKFTWTKRVTLRYKKYRITLLSKGRVKINGKRITKFPVVEMPDYSPQFSILKRRENVIVKLAQEDVTVTWDGRSFVEISVGTEWKNKVCGLCGNYNGEPDDDFRDRNDKLVTNLLAFARGWKHGKLKHCKLKRDRKYYRKLQFNNPTDVTRRPSVNEFPNLPKKPWEVLNGFGTNRVTRKKNTETVSPFVSVVTNVSRKILVRPKVDYNHEAALDINIIGPTPLTRQRAKVTTLKHLARYVADRPNSKTSANLGRSGWNFLMQNNGAISNNRSLVTPEPVQSGFVQKKMLNSHRKHNRRKNRNRGKRRLRCKWTDKFEKRVAMLHCEMIKGELFERCHNFVDWKRFYRTCITDACECPLQGQCYCESLLAYARECERANVMIDWSSRTQCRSDGHCEVTGAVFITCSKHNRQNFTNAFCSSKLSNSLKCKPGCYCPVGMRIHNNQCIKLDQCPKLN